MLFNRNYLFKCLCMNTALEIEIIFPSGARAVMLPVIKDAGYPCSGVLSCHVYVYRHYLALFSSLFGKCGLRCQHKNHDGLYQLVCRTILGQRKALTLLRQHLQRNTPTLSMKGGNLQTLWQEAWLIFRTLAGSLKR